MLGISVWTCNTSINIDHRLGLLRLQMAEEEYEISRPWGGGGKGGGCDFLQLLLLRRKFILIYLCGVYLVREAGRILLLSGY